MLAALAGIGQASPEALLTSRYAHLRAIGLVIEAPGEEAASLQPVTLRRRIGRILRLPGVPRPPRWSEIWPSSDDDTNKNNT